MSASPSSKFLKTVLIVDAATCLGFGILLVAGARLLAGWLGLPVDLLFYAGVILFPCAALMTITGRQKTPNAGLVWLIILGNFGWAIASIGILILPTITPNTLGYAFVIVQAVTVSALAVFEHRLLGNAKPLVTA
jgi:cytochrome bd-type quinol oxidase subunit 2